MMMNCQETQKRITEYMHRELPEGEASRVFAHIESCVSCAKILADEQQFSNIFKEMPVPEASYGFVDRALQTAVDRHDKRDHHSGFVKGFASAVAATLVVWLVVTGMPVGTDAVDDDSQANVMRISLHQTNDVKLAFFAEQAIADATIKISLSENMNLAGYQGRQTLEWQTSLKKGDNILTLPIQASNVNKGRLVAEVKHKDLVKSIVIEFDVQKPGVSDLSNHINIIT